MNCLECGAPLVRVLGEETITTLDGQTLLFRRTSDYLLCRSCLRLYSVVTLRDVEGAEPEEVGGELSLFSSLTEDERPEGFVERRSTALEAEVEQ
jgi:hypothetical protein